MSLRIALVDDHAMFREGLRSLLAAQHDLQVVGEAGDARAAYALVEQTQPDVLVLDVKLPGSNGITVAREVHRSHPHVKILFTTMHVHEEYVAEGISAGAIGYIGKEQPASDLVVAIRSVGNGQPYISPKISKFLVDDYIRARTGGETAATTPLDSLSQREREVFDLLLQGFTNDGIAAQLFISRRTVETHRAHVFKKLRVNSLAQLYRLASRHGLLD